MIQFFISRRRALYVVISYIYVTIAAISICGLVHQLQNAISIEPMTSLSTLLPTCFGILFLASSVKCQSIAQAELLMKRGQMKSAETVLLNLYNSGQISDPKQVADLCHLIGTCKVNFGSKKDARDAIHYFRKAESFYSQESTRQIDQLALLNYKMGQAFLYIHGDSVKLSVKRVLALVGENELVAGKALALLAFLQIYQENFSEAKDNYVRAESIYQQHLSTDDVRWPDFYTKLGTFYRRIGDVYQARFYYERALEILTRHQPENHLEILVCQNDLALSLYDQKEYLKAIDQLNLVREKLFRNSKTQDRRTAALLNNIGNCYFQLGRFNLASDYYLQALEIKENLSSYADVAYQHNQVAATYLHSKQPTKAKYHLDRAKYLFESNEDLERTINIHYAQTMSGLAEVEKSYKNFDAATELYFDALKAVGVDRSLNNLSEIHTSRSSRIAHFLGLLAKSWYQSYLHSKNESHLRKSWKIYETVLDQITVIRGQFIEPYSKQNLFEESIEIFEGALRVLHELYRRNEDQRYFTAAFRISEAFKNSVLLETIKIEDLGSYRGALQQALKNLKTLKSELAAIEDELFLGGGENHDKLLTERFNLKLEYDSLKEIVASRVPLLPTINDPTKEIQAMLTKRNGALAVVEYFVGKENVYSFIFKKGETLFKILPKDYDLDSSVEKFRKGIYGPFVGASTSIGEGRKELIEQGVLLFDKLIRPLGKLPEELLIIPDNVLGYLPFELLLETPPEERDDFKSYPFLIKNHAVSYDYSIALRSEMANHTNETKGTLVFTPSFGNCDTLDIVEEILCPLNYNQSIGPLLENLVGATVLQREKATKDQFLLKSAEYDVFHFDTHAKANASSDGYSYLAFTPQADLSPGSLLFAKDIANMRLNANMVYLEGCETGVGKLKTGEGIISLARSFSIAGAKSLVTSLWKIDDRSSSLVAEKFYKHLKLGDEKHAALRKAKLDYLSQSKEIEGHPFYWGGMICIGDVSTLTIGEGASWNPLSVIMVFAALILVFLGINYFRK